MKDNRILLLFVLLLQIICLNSQYSPLTNINRRVLQDRLLQQPCYITSNNQEVAYNLANLFSNIKTTRKINISGWFFFQGYEVIRYPLFSIHQNDENIVQLIYYVANNSVFLKVKQISYPLFGPQINVNQWYFIVLQIERISDTHIKFNGRMYINNNIIQLNLLPQYFTSPFNLEEIYISIGNPPQRFNLQPSCSLIKNVSVYVDSDLYLEVVNPIDNYIFKNESKLLFHYDTFYSFQNQNYLINDQGYLQQKVNLQFPIQNSFQLDQGQKIHFSDIDLNGESGFIVSFYAKWITSPFQPCLLANIFCYVLQISIQVYENSVIIGSDSVIAQSAYKWHNFLIILDNQNEKIIHVLVDGQQLIDIRNPPSFDVKIFNIQFEPNTCSIWLSHLRIYLGSALSTEGNCYISSMNFSQNTCLFCKNGYILDFQNKMTCVLKSSYNSDNEINGVRDWQPQRNFCPINMINDEVSPNECKCIEGYFKQDNKCEKCPQHCILCKSLADCNKQRDQNGICQNNAFDDGQSCIQPLFIIPERFNFVKVFEKPYFGNQCIEMDPNLSNFQVNLQMFNLQQGNTFFFSFSLDLKHYVVGFQNLIVAYLLDNSNEILSIKIVETLIYSYPLFKLSLYLKSKLIKEYNFNPLDIIWIGFWTNNNRSIFLLRVNRQNYYNEIEPKELYSSQNLTLCIGRCDRVIDGCFSLKATPFTFIKNIPYPTSEGIKDMFTLLQPDVSNISKYKFSTKQLDFDKEVLNLISIYPGTDLIFTQLIQHYNDIQGFGLTENYYTQVYLVTDNLYGLLSFSCNIEFENSDQQNDTQFMSIQFQDSQIFQVFFMLDSTLEIVRIRICFLDSCKHTNYAFLNLYQSNFIFIYAKQVKNWERIQFEQLFEIEVVCNFMRESFYFSGAIQSISIIDFTIGNSSDKHIYYLDNVNIYEEYGFIYFDYTKNDSCFLYLNKQEMKCVHLKEGFLKYNGKIITKEECLNISLMTKQLHIMNKKEQSCELKLSNSNEDQLCAIGVYIGKEVVCKICRDKYADPQKKCSGCKQHYFINTIINACEECDIKCKECSKTKTNCSDCYSQNQYPPYCNCILSNSYLDQNYQCQPCSNKCSTCIDTPLSCLTCSEEGRILPNCDCDYQHYEIDSQCKQIQCDSKCSKCSSSSSSSSSSLSKNCTECSANRVNPPDCICDDGYEETSNGKCEECGQQRYFNSQIGQCISCQPYCLQCNQNECLSCMQGLQIQGDKCICESDQSPYLLHLLSPVCLQSMDLQLIVVLSQNQYILKFLLDLDLESVDFSNILLSDIMDLYIPEIDSSFYAFSDPLIVGNSLQLQLKVMANFKATLGYAIIKNNQYFISKTHTHVLNINYTNKPIKFKIGPFLLKQKVIQTPGLDDLNNQISELKESNKDWFDFLRQIQFVFYLLNTLQPISLFLLLNARFPPQLYKFYQFIGTFIFPFVPDYQSTNYKTEFTLFHYKLEKIDSQQTTIGQFSKLGFCLSMVVNIPIIVIKYTVLLFLLLITQIFGYSKMSSPFLLKIKTFTIQRLNAENEVNLTSILLCILVQFSAVQGESYLYRVGFYFAMIFIVKQILMFNFNYFNIMNQSELQNEYSAIFIGRIAETEITMLKRCYFQIQYIKKFIYIIILYFLFDYAQLTCLLCCLLFLISAITTQYSKPYFNKASRLIKILGDIILSIVWLIHIFILKLETQLLNQPIIDNILFEKYIQLGKVVIIFLLALNLLFFLQILIDIYLFINEKIKNHQKQQILQYGKILGKNQKLVKI